MKGIICQEIGRLERSSLLPEPEPADGMAIVSIKRIGICGTDYHAFKGNQPFFIYPRILGHELSGVVESLGAGPTELRAGDRVGIIPYLHCGRCIACRSGKSNCCCDMRVLGVHLDGGMRERISVPLSHLVPANGISLDQAAMLEPLAIGAHAVRRSSLQAGETVLVIGGGPIGLGVMALAKRRGAKVIAVDVNERRLQFCGKWGKADILIPGTGGSIEPILNACGGELPTVVFDATGHAGSMAEAFRYVAHGGRLVYVGLVKAEIAFDDPEFHKREMTLLASRNATREDFETVMQAFQDGSVDIGDFISHRTPFDDAIESFEQWLRPESQVIKAVLELI